MISKRYRHAIIAVSIAFMSACNHTSHDDLRAEASRETMQAFADAYRQEQQGRLLRNVSDCEVKVPETMMLKRHGGLYGAVYYPPHEIPVFVEKASLPASCVPSR